MGRRGLISVITPTWHRHDLLLGRCVPSVRAQTYPDVEHVVVSDPDPELQALVAGLPVVYGETVTTGPGGADARNHALTLARGNLIAYLDDDDAYRPDHLRLLADALESDPAAGFAYSRAVIKCAGDSVLRIGDGPLAHGRVLSCMLLHRRELLDVASWRSLIRADDWDLVSRWLDAGITCASVDAVTCDYYPSVPLTGTPACFPPHRPVPHAASRM